MTMITLSDLDFATKKEALHEMGNRFKKLNIQELVEMTDYDSAFLCGILDRFKPKKIVELGIAAGGTTGIILKKLSKRQDASEVKMFSCDYAEYYYRNNRLKEDDLHSGFLAENIRELAPIQHQFLLGKYLPQYINEIGDDIDFVILDTVHKLPGEVLDFLAIFPYLKKDAIVVLHDISYNLKERQSMQSFSNAALWSSVVADKYINWITDENGKNQGYPNIGAFQINQETQKYIDNLFYLFMLTWAYIPSTEELSLYCDLYSEKYDEEFVAIFNEACRKQMEMIKSKLPMKLRLKRAIKMITEG